MEITEKLKSFDDNKLIDIVKNYRQYKYDDTIRNTALSILESRGINLDILELRGDLTNSTYDEAKVEFEAFERSSKKAFLFYGMMLFLLIAVPLSRNHETLQLSLTILSLSATLGFFILLIKSFINQAKYYKLIGKENNQLNPGLYFTVGLIVYAVMYFMFRKQMRDEMNDIR